MFSFLSFRERRIGVDGMSGGTIAAISSAAADSGIGIVRISGPDAFAVIDRIYRPKSGKKKLSGVKSHTIHYGYIVDGTDVIDEVLVMVMRAPSTFTAEDTVEVDCHGGVCAMRRILEAAVKNGARPAQPGEFTKKAFLNGRIDLSQAEAVMDVIQSKNEYALRNSVNQLKGSVKKETAKLRERILYHIARIEAALDDPEHLSLDGYEEESKELSEIRGRISHLIETADNGRILKEGIRTVIVGRPNAGKSSLLNALLGEERAIVTEIAGTTRDTLEETVNRGGITLIITDTAGIRKTDDVVERIGVGRAKEKLEQADLVLYVVDSSEKLDENDKDILELLKKKKGIILLNKSDRETVTTSEEIRKLAGEGYPILPISALEGTGIDLLEEKLKELFYEGSIPTDNEVCITNMRHKALLMDAEKSLERVQESIALGMPEDFLTIDLMDACRALGEITGETASDDIVNEIFGKFCLGK